MNQGIIILGVVFIVLGIIALNYAVVVENNYLGGIITHESIEKPYKSMGFPILLAGVVLVVAGLALNSRRIT